MQVVQASEDSFTVYMPVSGVRIDAFHCDARAMTNVIPTVNYCKWLFIMLLHTAYINFIHNNDWNTITQNILRKFFLLIVYNITIHNCMVALIYYDSPYNVLPNVSWEFQISVEYLSAIMKQVNASQMGHWYILASVHANHWIHT